MIDIHSHIINEIDDGSRDFDESIAIAKKMEGIGYNTMVVTPHYVTGSKYICDNKSKQEKLDAISLELKKQNIEMKLLLGNEVFIDSDIVSLVKKKKIATMNGSKYILIELPVSRAMNDLFEILFEIRSKGYIPIIAHPERYTFLQENPSMTLKFLEMGCLFQGNMMNIVEKYGRHAKKLFLYMLKNNQYQILATDVHHQDDMLFQVFPKVKKELIHLTSEETFRLLTEENPLKVLNNEQIEININSKEKKFHLFYRKK